MNTAAVAVHRHTPAIQAFDARGRRVREIAYLRQPDDSQVLDLVTHHQWDVRGFLEQSADPRLHDRSLWNLRQQTDLAGQVLCTRSVDAGVCLLLNDAARRPSARFDHIRLLADDSEDQAELVTRRWNYEDATLRGRPLRISEQPAGQAARFTECFVYAGASPGEQALNLAGRCVRHYDPAGVLVTDEVALSGVPSAQRRFLLEGDDDYETEVDWQDIETFPRPDSPFFITRTCTDASGAPLVSTDAAGHRQRIAYDVAGQIRRRWLALKDGVEMLVSDARTYDAAGGLLYELHGNGVQVCQVYDAQTRRLMAIRVERPAGHPLGTALLQDLRYEYDPVGNVTRIDNVAESRRFWRNQEVLPESTYRYDSLYRLVQATGREMASVRWQGGRQVAGPIVLDEVTYTRYTRSYSYDSGANLIRIRHSAPVSASNHTVDITVSERSCRAVLGSLADNPQDVEALFTGSGGQRWLQPGQVLGWTSRAEVRSVALATREETITDHEHYRYDADRQRVLKITRQASRVQRVLYLPGLELRVTGSGDGVSERLHVICMEATRLLHWEHGQPSQVDNDTLRYSYTTLTGSRGLELDGQGAVISKEEYYPYGGTAIWTARNEVEADCKTLRYSGKERDATGLYYFGYRYYQPWVGRWLSADPAGMPDGPNPYAMVGNNPASFFDVEGLMMRSPQGDHGGYSPPPYIVLAAGLTAFPLLERDQVIEAMDEGLRIMGKATQTGPLPDEEMRTWFGPAHGMYTQDVVATWDKVERFMQVYASPHPGYEKIHRISSSDPDRYALVNSDDIEGKLLIDAEFFASTTTLEERALTIIHELSHLSEVTRVVQVGAGTRDFFYLQHANPKRDSTRIVEKGEMADEDLEDPMGLFNEIAALDGFVVSKVDKNLMSYTHKQQLQFMTIRQAQDEFETRPLLRARVATRNADSIAYGALAVAGRR